MSLKNQIRAGARSERAVTWYGRLTDWTSWMRLLVAPSSTLLVIALAATAVAKTTCLLGLRQDNAWWVLPESLLLDVVVLMGLVALLSWLEAHLRSVEWLTLPIAAAAALISCLNAAYLLEAGEQWSWSMLEILTSHQEEAELVIRDALSIGVVASVIFGAGLLAACAVILRKFLWNRSGPWDRKTHGQARFVCAMGLALPAALISLVAPTSDSVDVRFLAKNALLNLVHFEGQPTRQAGFVGYPNPQLVSDASIKAFASGSRPNLLIYVLESTRYDHTSLAPVDQRRAESPVLAELANTGVVAHQARTVMPHTTKALLSILCARLPTMQRKLIEVSADVLPQCLPAILRQAGYRTAFLQSAMGGFEERPRLIAGFGFDQFRARKDLGGQALGYLASEDEALVPGFARWLDEESSAQPFFATILTSATHHPYVLPAKVERRAIKRNKPIAGLADRYARLVEEQDRVLGLLLETLRSRELLESTTILVVGDHGEGLGDHGVRNHNNNYFEEGLRVPFVLVGPGIRSSQIHQNVSLVDIVPTLLSHFQISLVPELRGELFGHNILASDFNTRDVPRFFGCYNSMRCRGFMLGPFKIINVPEEDYTWAFDLRADLNERSPVSPDSHQREYINQLHTWVGRHQAAEWKMLFPEITFDNWHCPEGVRRCKRL